MKEKTFYLHVCYETISSTGVVCHGHLFAARTAPFTFEDLRNEINNQVEKGSPGHDWNKKPTIISITELSKELFYCLFSPKEEDKNKED